MSALRDPDPTLDFIKRHPLVPLHCCQVSDEMVSKQKPRGPCWSERLEEVDMGPWEFSTPCQHPPQDEYIFLTCSNTLLQEAFSDASMPHREGA